MRNEWVNQEADAKRLPVEQLLLRFTEMSRQIFGDRLTGVYLHGSAAMGCFHPEKSDLDLLLVVENPIPQREKLDFLRETVRLDRQAPPKGLELSVIRREVCRPFVYPTPFELHFSAAYRDWCRKNPEEYLEQVSGTDKDLAAHVTVTRRYGRVLYGVAIEEVFGDVPREAYIDSIWNDVRDAQERILSDPVYLTLNLCRVLGYLEDGQILSKQTGGEWGMCSLPGRYHPLIRRAMTCYGSGQVMRPDQEGMAELAREYAGSMLEKIRELI